MCFTLALPLSIPNEDVVPLWCLKRFMKALKISIKSFEAPKRSAKIKTWVNFYFNTTFWNAKSFQSHDDQVTDTHFEVLPPNPSLSQEDKFSSNWKLLSEICMYSPPRFWNNGLVSSGASLTSWGEGASLALVAHPSSDGITIKMPYGVDVLHRPASHPIFSYWVG